MGRERMRFSCGRAYSSLKVTKFSVHHEHPIPRILSLTDSHLLEQDATSVSLVSARRWAELFALVRHEDQATCFEV